MPAGFIALFALFQLFHFNTSFNIETSKTDVKKTKADEKYYFDFLIYYLFVRKQCNEFIRVYFSCINRSSVNCSCDFCVFLRYLKNFNEK